MRCQSVPLRHSKVKLICFVDTLGKLTSVNMKPHVGMLSIGGKCGLGSIHHSAIHEGERVTACIEILKVSAFSLGDPSCDISPESFFWLCFNTRTRCSEHCFPSAGRR